MHCQFCNFSCKISVTFDSSQDILCLKKTLDVHILFLVFTYIYLIKYRFNLDENLFLKKVIAITHKFLKKLQLNITLNYSNQTFKT